MNRSISGFTLLEIMLAAAIFAVVSVSLMKSSASSVSRAVLISDRTAARWIAENQLQQFRMEDRKEDKTFPSVGVKRSSVTMMNREWHVILEISETENNLVRRLEVSVFDESDMDTPLSVLTGFRGRY